MIKSTLFVCLLVGCQFFCLAAVAAELPSQHLGLHEPPLLLELPELDRAKMIAVDEHELGKIDGPRPLRYAISHEVPATPNKTALDAGEWLQLDNDDWLWRAKIAAKGALSIDLGFRDFWLPHGAEVYLHSADRKTIRGPYTDRDNNTANQLWTPFVPGDTAYVELRVPAATRDAVRLELGSVQQGYREFWKPQSSATKSGSCNVDVVCPAGDNWRDQIRSVARFSFRTPQGSFVCTGQLINTTANTNEPYFLTANHCGLDTDQIAGTMVLYWNYESTTCREPGSNASGTPLPTNDLTTSGATPVAANATSDFSLLRLNQAPPSQFEPFWSGWSREMVAPSRAVGIHHPAGHAKRISIEEDATCFSSYLGTCGGNETNIRVEDWDLGTTEGGSSGSGLWNPDGHLVGQLQGGFAACGNDDADYYGSFAVSWARGATAQTRLRDWLDPTGSDANVVDGIDGCSAPDVSLTSSRPNGAALGETVVLSASASGGAGGYGYQWDTDGDGQFDTTGDQIEIRYPQRGSYSVRSVVTDSAGCSRATTLGQVVRGHSIAASSNGSPTQICGDGDGDIEPGERWSFPVRLSNNGDAAITGGHAAFGVDSDFGYSQTDSSSNSCSFDYVDIGTAQNAQTVTATDDGVATIMLGGAGLNFYGTRYQQLAASTNGYLSTDLGDTGQDFDNDCPLPVAPQANFQSGVVDFPNAGRLAVLHDDLVLGSSQNIYHQHFAVCPRTADVGPTAQGCNVVQWNDAGFFNPTGDPVGNFGFQAILYDQSLEIVYQYLPGSPADEQGRNSTTAIQAPGAAEAVTYACNQAGSITPNSAVCTFHPDFSPGSEDGGGGVVLENNTVPLELQPNQSINVNLEVRIAADFTCGGAFRIDYLGAASVDGYSPTAQANLIAVNTATNCNSTASCPSPAVANKLPREGFWWNPSRSGNGIDVHRIGDVLYAAWYTGDEQRNPIWYYIQLLNGQSIEDNHTEASLLRFELDGNILNTTPQFEIVGDVLFSFIDPSTALMTWTLNGQPGGELIQFLDLATTEAVPAITDQWFNPNESGWGLGTHRQGPNEFSAIYLYDNDGDPRWVTTIETQRLLSQGSSLLSSFRVHCPGCVWSPEQELPAGNLSRSLNDDGTGNVSIDINMAEPQIQWQRNNLPIQRIGDGG